MTTQQERTFSFTRYLTRSKVAQFCWFSDKWSIVTPFEYFFFFLMVAISVCVLAVHCGKPLVAYSHVINEKTAKYHYPATVRMSCDDGYDRADGSNSLRCLANGQWNDTSLRCTRKWSSGVRYHLVRFCVCLFFGQNLIQPQIRLPAANYFHFSPVEMKCLWQEARVHEAL